MAISRLSLIRAKLDGVYRALDRSSGKNGQVSIELAKDFNATLSMARDTFPEIAEALPADIKTTGQFARLGVAQVTFTDLAALAEQVISLLELVEEE